MIDFERDVLLVIDVQNDFLPGGGLAVPRGDEIIPAVNRLGRRFRHVVLSQDWHPPGHGSFASSYPGRQPFEITAGPQGEQVLWPDHCVQATPGAAFPAALDIPHADLILRKGTNPGLDSYSAFFENDRTTPTGLQGYLRERGFSRVVMCGLAFDYCVAWSAEDARRLRFDAVVVEDACRAIDLDGSADAARRRMLETGVTLVREADLTAGLVA